MKVDRVLTMCYDRDVVATTLGRPLPSCSTVYMVMGVVLRMDLHEETVS